MTRMERLARVLGFVFAAELLLVLALGAAGAWRLGDPVLRWALLPAVLAWGALAVSTRAAPGSAWAGWTGTLQFVACWLAFPLFKAIRQVFVRHPADAPLLRLDRWLWGGESLPEHMLDWERPWLSELLSAGYFSFYFIVLVPVVCFAWRRRGGEARAFFFGLMLMYMAGFVGYMLVPAGGPFLAFPETFPYPPQGGAMTAFLTGLVAQGITGMDVFPSLHTGIGLYVLGFFALSGRRTVAWLLAPWVAALVVATVYLRYHYGVDLLAGIVLAAAALAMVQRYREAVSA